MADTFYFEPQNSRIGQGEFAPFLVEIPDVKLPRSLGGIVARVFPGIKRAVMRALAPVLREIIDYVVRYLRDNPEEARRMIDKFLEEQGA